MSTCGMIGGVSFVSTLHYYRRINEIINQVLGGLHSGNIIINSINLQEYANHFENGEIEQVKELLNAAAIQLSKLQVSFIIISSNTAHIAAKMIEQHTPVLHIVDCCVHEIKQSHKWCPNIKIGFIGTKYSMESTYISARFEKHGAVVITPKELVVRKNIQKSIEDDLSHSPINNNCVPLFLSAINELIERGAAVIILGCTEIPLVIKKEHVPHVPLIDSSECHINLAAKVMLKQVALEDVLPQRSVNNSK